jgi:hypothetical protein
MNPVVYQPEADCSLTSINTMLLGSITKHENIHIIERSFCGLTAESSNYIGYILLDPAIKSQDDILGVAG